MITLDTVSLIVIACCLVFLFFRLNDRYQNEMRLYKSNQELKGIIEKFRADFRAGKIIRLPAKPDIREIDGIRSVIVPLDFLMNGKECA